MNEIDVIIPVHNRPEVLYEALHSLVRQRVLPGWHVRCIVANDGNSGDIATVVAQAAAQTPAGFTIDHLPLTKCGVAATRNAALAASHAPLVLLAAGDMLFQPDALCRHLLWHEHNPQTHLAALGSVKWDPHCDPTAFMEWMVHGGSQNDFDAILGQGFVDPSRYFFASHLSIKRAMLPVRPFETGYAGYGWEDLDLGHRLVKTGLKLHFLPDAIGLHHHHYTTRDIYERQLSVGRNFTIFQARHKLPDAPRLTRARKLRMALFRFSGAAWVLWQYLSLRGENSTHPYLFQIATTAQFWLGVWKSTNKITSNEAKK